MYLSGLSNVVFKSWSSKKVEGKGEALQCLWKLGLCYRAKHSCRGLSVDQSTTIRRLQRAHLSFISFMRVVDKMDQPLLFHPGNSRQLHSYTTTTVRQSNTSFQNSWFQYWILFHRSMAVSLYSLGTPITLLVSLFLLIPEAELLTGAQCSPREGRINWSQSELCHLCGAAGLNWSYYQWHPTKAPAPHPWPLTFPFPFYRG